MAKEYDVLQVEDNEWMPIEIKRVLEKGGWSYKLTGSLEELENVLKSGDTARIYVVDGKFPFKKGGRSSLLIFDAVEMIKKHHFNANIVLYPADSEENFRTLVNQENVTYLRKNPETNLTKELKRKLEAIV